MGSKALGADVVLALESAKRRTQRKKAVAFLLNDKITQGTTRQQLEEEWDESLGSPVAAASSGEIDDIIDSKMATDRRRHYDAVGENKCTPARRHANMPLKEGRYDCINIYDP